MKKRILAICMAAITLGMTLTGCETVQQSAEVEALTDNTDKTAAKMDETVALTVWGAEQDQEMLAEMIEGFKEKYANEAAFEITLGVESESSCKEALLGDVLNGADVFAFADDQLMTLIAAGALAPVENAEKIKADNMEEAVEAASYNDILYAYPMTADNGYFMYYDKSVFSESDVASLDTMLASAEAAGKKVAMELSSGWYLYSFFGNTGMNMALNEDGVTMSCDWNGTGGIVKGADVAQSILSIATHPGFANMTDEQIVAGIKDGTVAAAVSGVWNSSTVAENWGVNYGACKLPTYTCAGQQIQMASFSGYKMVGVNAYSEYKEWGLKLAEWITNEENQKVRFEKREQGPSNINAADSDAVQNAPAIQALLSQAEFSVLQRVGNNFWDPMTNLGNTLAAGNPDGKNLQELMDTTVEGITAFIVQ
ncbi:MAG: extracellular solute-binding protein [Lachnospiraceae bacterium]|nr:extracellular solute-binding protein [Lachnospiraceae bacterium]